MIKLHRFFTITVFLLFTLLFNGNEAFAAENIPALIASGHMSSGSHKGSSHHSRSSRKSSVHHGSTKPSVKTHTKHIQPNLPVHTSHPNVVFPKGDMAPMAPVIHHADPSIDKVDIVHHAVPFIEGQFLDQAATPSPTNTSQDTTPPPTIVIVKKKPPEKETKTVLKNSAEDNPLQFFGLNPSPNCTRIQAELNTAKNSLVEWQRLLAEDNKKMSNLEFFLGQVIRSHPQEYSSEENSLSVDIFNLQQTIKVDKSGIYYAEKKVNSLLKLAAECK